MKILNILSIAILLVLLTGCSKSNNDPDGDVTYKVTFTGLWQEEDHGLPTANTHFTQIIGATHNSDYFIFKVGELATAGLEQTAEDGINNILEAEIDAQIKQNNIFSKFLLNIAFGGTATANGTINLKEEFPYFSIATMLAPSPDWFTGINSLSLYVGENWIADTTVYLRAYDAGTEDGDNFSLSNPATSPQEPVTLLIPLSASALAKNDTIKPVAKIRFELLP